MEKKRLQFIQYLALLRSFAKIEIRYFVNTVLTNGLIISFALIFMPIISDTFFSVKIVLKSALFIRIEAACTFDYHVYKKLSTIWRMNNEHTCPITVFSQEGVLALYLMTTLDSSFNPLGLKQIWQPACRSYSLRFPTPFIPELEPSAKKRRPDRPKSPSPPMLTVEPLRYRIFSKGKPKRVRII